MFRRSWRSQMTASEGQRGAVFFLLYLLVFPRLNAWVQRVLMGDGEALVAEANVIYYLFLFIITLFVFWGFLRKDLEQLLDWLPENLFGVVLGLALAGGAALLLRQIPFLPVNPISRQYAEEFAAAPTATLVLILVLIPVVEETLYRGLFFGQLRGYSRTLAMWVSILFYTLAHVWRYALEVGDILYLLPLALLSLPMSIALTWCYDNGGSVWSCVVLHGALNGLSLLLGR